MVVRANSPLIDRNCPVHICGMKVEPGALIHADCHGAITIPAEACRRVANAEIFVLDLCREAIRIGEKPTVDQLRQWRGEMGKHR